jgi:hypothetical protein
MLRNEWRMSQKEEAEDREELQTGTDLVTPEDEVMVSAQQVKDGTLLGEVTRQAGEKGSEREREDVAEEEDEEEAAGLGKEKSKRKREKGDEEEKDTAVELNEEFLAEFRPSASMSATPEASSALPAPFINSPSLSSTSTSPSLLASQLPSLAFSSSSSSSSSSSTASSQFPALPANEYEEDHEYDYARLLHNPISVPLHPSNRPAENFHFKAASKGGEQGKGEGAGKETVAKAGVEAEEMEAEVGSVQSSFMPGMLHYNNRAKSVLMITPAQAEDEFQTGPWDAVNNIALKYFVQGIYRGNVEIAAEVKSVQKNYINCKQDFYDADEFLEDTPNFFRNISQGKEFPFFGDFHCRLQNACVSEASAERAIKHGKRMITKNTRSAHPTTVVKYIMSSSRKDVKNDQKGK